MASLGAEVGFVLTNQAVRVVGLFIAAEDSSLIVAVPIAALISSDSSLQEQQGTTSSGADVPLYLVKVPSIDGIVEPTGWERAVKFAEKPTIKSLLRLLSAEDPVDVSTDSLKSASSRRPFADTSGDQVMEALRH